jgi:predicted  nucleic acid-binding Zn-ribbon protein
MTSGEFKSKSFWKRPEGITGALVMGGVLIGGGILIATALPAILAFVKTTLGLVVTLFALGAIIYMALDPKMRNLVWYMYKSIMRWVTGIFVQIDPIGILKSYVQDLKDNLRKMNKQISKLRGQMHKLKELIITNQREIKSNLTMASKAKDNNKKSMMILKSRKAGRLRESNMKLEDLYKKMEILYRVLSKMYENSEIMLEDIQDQVMVKEQERKAMRASHSAMKSAMNIITGNADKRAMFDQALEAVADDVSQKVGEMERFMEMSDNFMKSVDLQNGVFEEEGLKMLEQWENEGISLLLGEEKEALLLQANNDEDVLDLSAPIKTPEKIKAERFGNQYDNFFD